MSDPTKHFYAAHAKEYENKTKDLPPVDFLRRFMMHVCKDGNVLEIGCAFGRDCVTLVDNGFTVTGLDYSDEFLKRAKEVAPGAAFLKQDIRELSLPANSFNGVYSNLTFLHLTKKELPSALHNVHSALRLEGIFAISMKEGIGEGLIKDARYEGEEKYFAYYEKTELEKNITDAGFRVLESTMYPISSAYQDKPILEIIAKKI